MLLSPTHSSLRNSERLRRNSTDLRGTVHLSNPPAGPGAMESGCLHLQPKRFLTEKTPGSFYTSFRTCTERVRERSAPLRTPSIWNQITLQHSNICTQPGWRKASTTVNRRNECSKNAIERAISDWADYVVFALETDDKVHLCVDYRKLSMVFVRNTHPLTQMEDCSDSLEDAAIFFTIDCSSE